MGHVAGCFECGDELSGSINYGEFLDWLRNKSLFKDCDHGVSYKQAVHHIGSSYAKWQLQGVYSFRAVNLPRSHDI